MTVCRVSSSGADEEMAIQCPLKVMVGLLAPAILIVFVFALLLSVAVFLFGFGKKLFMPESYWTDEVTTIEASISSEPKTFKACQQDAVKKDRASAELYAKFLKKV
jgi:hypothetical protein